MAQPKDFFAGRTGVLATMHRKEEVMAPILAAELGITLTVPEHLNTDTFGTFTRDIPRMGTQREAARHKAQKALALTGSTLSLASEGSFQPHPACPFIGLNCELVLLLDTQHELELVGEFCSTETNYSQQTVHTLAEAQAFATKSGFPSHGLVIFTQPELGAKSPVHKGITSQTEFTQIVQSAFQSAPQQPISIETDMRALYNPTRMKNIARATQALVRSARSCCPTCQWPGFSVVKRLEGLPCALCHFPTARTLAHHYQCQKCNFHQEVRFPDGVATADPADCPLCNP